MPGLKKEIGMHRSEISQLYMCASCSAQVSPRDRTYAFGEDDLLCFECAVARSGVYDEAHDRWSVVPYVADLLLVTRASE